MDIAYEADLRLAKKLLQELVKNDPSVIQSMEHNVFVNELGSSSVVLGVRAWVKVKSIGDKMADAGKYQVDTG